MVVSIILISHAHAYTRNNYNVITIINLNNTICHFCEKNKIGDVAVDGWMDWVPRLAMWVTKLAICTDSDAEC